MIPRPRLRRLLVPGLIGVVGLVGCGGGDGPTGTAQTGTIAGTVSAEGSGLAGVSVGLSTGSTQETNASGAFRFEGVPAGNHTLTLALPDGYELDQGETTSKQVSVSAGATSSISWALRQAELPTAVEVQMNAASFSPSDVSLALGGTVTWSNAQAIPHTITPSNPQQAGTWTSHSVPAEQGYTFSHTFQTAGTYSYACQIHAGMTGTVRVR